MSFMPIDPRRTQFERVLFGLFAAGANDVPAFQASNLSRGTRWIEDETSQMP
jgi:hypothetical protein